MTLWAYLEARAHGHYPQPHRHFPWHKGSRQNTIEHCCLGSTVWVHSIIMLQMNFDNCRSCSHKGHSFWMSRVFVWELSKKEMSDPFHLKEARRYLLRTSCSLHLAKKRKVTQKKRIKMCVKKSCEFLSSSLPLLDYISFVATTFLHDCPFIIQLKHGSSLFLFLKELMT